jgi:peptidoglycan-associated lipoprotein
MIRSPRKALPLTLFGLLVLVAACSKKPPVQTAPAPTLTPAQTMAPATPVAVPTPPPRPSAMPEARVTDRTLSEIGGYLKPVFFDYDKADIRPDAKDALNADAEFLKKWPTLKVTIEGHSDERGTREYNMALGQRRAGAAKDYLASLGVEASRLLSISYGKERPFCTDHNEDCWQKNRRAHFVATAK